MHAWTPRIKDLGNRKMDSIIHDKKRNTAERFLDNEDKNDIIIYIAVYNFVASPLVA